MQKNKITFIGLAVLLIGISVWSLFLANSRDYPLSTKFLRFNYVIKNESGKLINEEKFVAAIPLQIRGIQTLESISSSNEYQITDASTVIFPIKNLPPYSSKIVDLTLTIKLTGKPKADSANAPAYLQAQKYIEIDSMEIKELAAQLKGDSAAETAKNIHQWLVNNITPSSYTADSKGAAYLLKNKTGDCTEFMYSFIALARANGIPARGISGFWIPGESSLINAADYHDWAEFYDGDEWVLVDASKNVFDENHGDYISLNVINDQRPFPRYGSESQNLTISNIK